MNREEVTRGTPPLSDNFKVILDTMNNSDINDQAIVNASESRGDDTSMKEILQTMDNFSVIRSSDNPVNGGNIWFIIFLRDKESRMCDLS
jgi:hypothetical protein